MPREKLEDAEKDFVEAIYRFRQAQDSVTSDYKIAKLEMLRLEAKVAMIRECIYRGTGYELLDRRQQALVPTGCPKPAWI